MRVSDDPEVTAYLAKIGGNLFRQLPPTHLNFRFYLVDWAAVNAFSVAGGRIYVSRKLAAFVNSDDELAAILAHEIGHIVTHQTAVQFSVWFQDVLGVTSLKDGPDVVAKYNQLMTSWRLQPKAFRARKGKGEEHQEAADRVGLELLAAAGYNPQTAAEVFDRVTESEGKTGTWLTNLLGATPPDQRRLREMAANIARLPAACVTEKPAAANDELKNWQSVVVRYSGWKRREVLDGVLAKVTLEPLRAQATHVKFSPDGRYILAQDVEKITVVSREPLTALFAIDAQDALPAQFSPDSKSVVWINRQLHIEEWDVMTQKRTGVHEPVVRKGCGVFELSSTGAFLGCIDGEATLRLIDLASGSSILEKQHFTGHEFTFAGLAFSPDSRYFLARSREHALGFDLQDRSEFPLRGQLRNVLTPGSFFAGSGRLFGWDSETRYQADLVSFPDGKLLGHVRVRPASFVPVTRGDFVLLRFADFSGKEQVGALNLSSMKVEKTLRRAGADIYGDTLAEEMADGEIGLYDVGSFKLQGRVKLPGGQLTRPVAAAVTGDFKWLALAAKERGAVWDLSTGKSVYLVREFHGAYLDRDWFCADFPKSRDTKRSVARFSLQQRSDPVVTNIEDEVAWQRGRYLLVTKTAKPLEDETNWGAAFRRAEQLARDITLEVRDAATGRTLWTRRFPKEAPRVTVEPVTGAMVLSWPASREAARDEAKRFPKIQEAYAAKGGAWNLFVEVVEAGTGKPTGAVLIDTNKYSIEVADLFAMGDWLVLQAASGQVLLYSISSGERIATILGSSPEASKESGLLCVRKGPDQLVVYDVGSDEILREYSFSSPVIFKQFSQDGKRLLAVTADQVAYQLDVSGPAGVLHTTVSEQNSR